MEEQKLGRFGHHPMPDIDYCLEIDELEAIAWNLEHGIQGDDREDYRRRLTKAADFNVGVDEGCLKARAALLPLIQAEEQKLKAEEQSQ